MVADTEVGNPGTESADNSRPFVAEYHRSRDVPVTRNNVQIGVAHSRGRDGHLNLAGSRLRELDIGAEWAPIRVSQTGWPSSTGPGSIPDGSVARVKKSRVKESGVQDGGTGHTGLSFQQRRWVLRH